MTVWTYPDAIHGTNFSSHSNDEHSIKAEWTKSTFVEFTSQRTHETRETEVRVHTYTHTSYARIRAY